MGEGARKDDEDVNGFASVSFNQLFIKTIGKFPQKKREVLERERASERMKRAFFELLRVKVPHVFIIYCYRLAKT